MTTETLLTITTITLPLITGGLGYLWKSSIEKKRKFLSDVSIERRVSPHLFMITSCLKHVINLLVTKFKIYYLVVKLKCG